MAEIQKSRFRAASRRRSQTDVSEIFDALERDGSISIVDDKEPFEYAEGTPAPVVNYESLDLELENPDPNEIAVLTAHKPRAGGRYTEEEAMDVAENREHPEGEEVEGKTQEEIDAENAEKADKASRERADREEKARDKAQKDREKAAKDREKARS